MGARYTDEHLILPESYVENKIGVVTVLYNSSPVLEDFFNSIEKQTCTDFIVYCIDNGSTDDSVQRCRDRGARYVVIENGNNLGVAAGNNIGTRAAIADGCEFVLYLNNDVVFGADLFGQLMEGLKSNNCSMTTPIMYYHDRPNVIWAAGGYFQPWLGYRCLHYGDGQYDRGQYSTRRIQYTPTCCVLVRRNLFSRVGLMDERYFVYYDDTDFMLRAYQASESLYLLTHVKLWHKVSSLVGKSSLFRTRYVHRNHALYGHKHLGVGFAYLVSFVYCLGYVFMALLGQISASEVKLRIRYWLEGIRVARTKSQAQKGVRFA